MDVLTFISHVVASLAWPVVIVVLALVFRRRLGELLDRLIELKVYKVSLKLEGAPQALRQVRRELKLPQVQLYETAERAITRPISSTTEIKVLHDRKEPFPLAAAEAAKTTPAGVEAIPDPSVEFEVSWRALQADLLEKAHQFGATRLRRAESAATYLGEKRAVPPEFQSAFVWVRAVYDAAKRHPHSPIDSELATEFKQTCEKLRRYLAQIDS